MTLVLLLLHGLCAVALLGAVTHQAIGVLWPASQVSDSFLARMRSVSAASYVTAVILLYLVTAILGGIIYAEYRINVRVVLEQYQFWKTHGAFELKEHFVALGLGMLPAYWYFWRQRQGEQLARPRAMVTAILALIVWWSFFVGHIVNNTRGLGS